MNFERKNKRIIGFVAISLSDIVLLLLIYFLLTSTYVMQPGIKVKLPKAASGVQEESDKIYISVTRNEQLYLFDQPVGLADLSSRLRPMLQTAPEKTVVIRADKDISLEATIRVIDTAKLAGAEKFLIATEKGL
ncbi:MAG TPA: biopolymer transporter ExbD [bacterium]|nr:biopolymer transporter ExbD [bacterium]HPN35735.1 biopolymer transporter ExbD [bacterium]